MSKEKPVPVFIVGDYVDSFRPPTNGFDPWAVEEGMKEVADVTKAIVEAVGPVTMVLPSPPGWIGPRERPRCTCHRGERGSMACPLHGLDAQPADASTTPLRRG